MLIGDWFLPVLHIVQSSLWSPHLIGPEMCKGDNLTKKKNNKNHLCNEIFVSLDTESSSSQIPYFNTKSINIRLQAESKRIHPSSAAVVIF